jgi:hypothetical protein
MGSSTCFRQTDRGTNAGQGCVLLRVGEVFKIETHSAIGPSNRRFRHGFFKNSHNDTCRILRLGVSGSTRHGRFARRGLPMGQGEKTGSPARANFRPVTRSIPTGAIEDWPGVSDPAPIRRFPGETSSRKVGVPCLWEFFKRVSGPGLQTAGHSTARGRDRRTRAQRAIRTFSSNLRATPGSRTRSSTGTKVPGSHSLFFPSPQGREPKTRFFAARDRGRSFRRFKTRFPRHRPRLSGPSRFIVLPGRTQVVGL